MKIALTQFAGMAPRVAPRLLPDNFAQEANEVKLWSGELRPFYEDTDVVDVPDDTKYIYKWTINEFGEYGFLVFPNKVNIVKGPVFGDENNRILISGLEGGLRITDTTMVSFVSTPEGTYEPTTVNTSNSYLLGIPAPTDIKMTLVVDGSTADCSSLSFNETACLNAKVKQLNDIKYEGKIDWTPEKVKKYMTDVGHSSVQDWWNANGKSEKVCPWNAPGCCLMNGYKYITGDKDYRENLESRTYVVALVREWSDGKLDIGKTSQPATYTDVDGVEHLTIDVGTGQAVHLSNITVPKNAYSECGVRKAYVYRSTVGSDGTATYGYVGEFAIKPNVYTYEFTDSRAASDVEESAVSLEWDAPEKNLTGLVSLNNGVLAAYSDQDIYFSYPYQVHAWPYTYRVSVDFPIVGLGAFGNTVVVCTTGCPSLVLVSDPAAATMKGIHDPFPCLSADSIVSMANGVCYASTGGLLFVNSTSPKYLTESLITKDEWRDWNPESFCAASYEGNYIATSTDPKKYHGLIVDTTDTTKGVVSLYRLVYGIFSDPESNSLYFVTGKPDGGRKIVLFDTPQDGNDQSYRTFKWRSKIFQSNSGIATFAAARVRNEYEGYYRKIKVTIYEYRTHTLNSVPMNTYSINGPVDMEQVYELLDKSVYMYFIYYVNGVPRYTRKLKNSEPFRLPSGFRGDEFEVEVEGEMPIHSIELATSMGELL